jgi:hypothetical protein
MNLSREFPTERDVVQPFVAVFVEYDHRWP